MICRKSFRENKPHAPETSNIVLVEQWVVIKSNLGQVGQYNVNFVAQRDSVVGSFYRKTPENYEKNCHVVKIT